MREPTGRGLVAETRNINRSANTAKPHQNWPKQTSDGLAFKELERQLRENPGINCKIFKLHYGDKPGERKANFGMQREVKSSMELEQLLLEQVSRCLSTCNLQ